MRNYIRSRTFGGTCFFTVNLAHRINNDMLVRYIDVFRQAVAQTKSQHPFQIDGMVILPEHLHAIWTLPVDDGDYSTRWRLIKAYFSRCIPKNEIISTSRQKKNERGIWQRRFWEHTICDDQDFANHMDYLHYNPVKHGYVTSVADWEFSTFHYWVKKGVYPADWGAVYTDVKLACADFD